MFSWRHAIFQALENSGIEIVDELLEKGNIKRGTGLQVKLGNYPPKDSSWNNSNKHTDQVSRNSTVWVVLAVFSGEIQRAKYNLS